MRGPVRVGSAHARDHIGRELEDLEGDVLALNRSRGERQERGQQEITKS